MGKTKASGRKERRGGLDPLSSEPPLWLSDGTLGHPPTATTQRATRPGEVAESLAGPTATMTQSTEPPASSDIPNVFKTEPSAAQLAREKDALAPLDRAASLLKDYDPSQQLAEMDALKAGGPLPFTDQALDDLQLETMIPALRRSIEFQEKYRENLITLLSERGDQISRFAAPAMRDMLKGVTSPAWTQALSQSTHLLGLYEGQRRTARIRRYDQMRHELVGEYAKFHTGLQLLGAAGAPWADLMKMDDAYVSKFTENGHTLFQGMAATRNVMTANIAHRMVAYMGNQEARQQASQKLTALGQQSRGEIVRSLSAAGMTRAKGYQAAEDIELIFQEEIDPEILRQAGFTSPDAYRLYRVFSATLPDSPIVAQLKPILAAPDLHKAVQNALENKGLSPPEVYGTVLGVYEVLQTLLLTGEAARARGEPGGITRRQFMGAVSRLAPLLTSSHVAGHVTQASSILGVEAGITMSPHDVHNLTADLAAPQTIGDLAKINALLGAYENVLSATGETMNGMSDGAAAIYGLKALGGMKAAQARSWGNIDDMQEMK